MSSCTFKDAINAKQGSKHLQPYKDEEPRDARAWSKDHLRTQWKADVLQRSRSQEGILPAPCHVPVSTALSTFPPWLSGLAAAIPRSSLKVQIISSHPCPLRLLLKCSGDSQVDRSLRITCYTLESTLTHSSSLTDLVSQ